MKMRFKRARYRLDCVGKWLWWTKWNTEQSVRHLPEGIVQRSIAAYQDDGFTGLNMERPDLQGMLRAIERRQINLVIMKDLSRLGRNYLQTGIWLRNFSQETVSAISPWMTVSTPCGITTILPRSRISWTRCTARIFPRKSIPLIFWKDKCFFIRRKILWKTTIYYFFLDNCI